MPRFRDSKVRAHVGVKHDDAEVTDAWPRAAAIGSAALSLTLKLAWPMLPFMDRVGVVFLACAAIAVVVSLAQQPRKAALSVELQDVDTRHARRSTPRRSS